MLAESYFDVLWEASKWVVCENQSKINMLQCHTNDLSKIWCIDFNVHYARYSVERGGSKNHWLDLLTGKVWLPRQNNLTSLATLMS